MLAETLRGDNGAAGQVLAFGHGGKHVLGCFVHTVFVVGSFQVQLQESLEGDDFTSGDEPLFAAGHGDFGHRLVEFGVGHLGGQRALVDEVVQALLLVRRIHRRGRQIGGSDGFVCFLRSLGFGGKGAGFSVLGAKRFGDLFLRGFKRQVAQVGRVGAHVSDATSLVQTLCDPHGAGHAEAQFPGRFLLQGGCRERRCRLLRGRLRLDGRDGVTGPLASRQEGLGVILGFERLVARRLHCRFASAKVAHDTEGGFSDVRIDFTLAVHDDADPHALHPTRTQFGPDFAPQHRAQVESHEAVQNAARLLGVHQINVHLTWRFNGLQNGGLGDLRKHDALGLLGLQSQRLHEVPADGLSFPVLIRREPHCLRLFCQRFELSHNLFA